MVGLAASAATVPLAACSPGSRTTASTSGGAGKASGVIKVAAFENAYGAAIYKQVAEAFGRPLVPKSSSPSVRPSIRS